MKQLKWKFKMILIAALIGFLALNIAAAGKTLFTKNDTQPIQTVYVQEKVTNEAEYVISEEAVYSHLQAKSQIISLQQDIHKKNTHVDDGLLGERHTELIMEGTLKMGLNTSDIEITHIDSKSGIVYVKLPEPIIISLEIPYDQVDFDKVKGWARLAMKEEEKKNFYKQEEIRLKDELIQDKELMSQADVLNRDAVMEIFKLMPEVKSVVFE